MKKSKIEVISNKDELERDSRREIGKKKLIVHQRIDVTIANSASVPYGIQHEGSEIVQFFNDYSRRDQSSIRFF